MLSATTITRLFLHKSGSCDPQQQNFRPRDQFRLKNTPAPPTRRDSCPDSDILAGHLPCCSTTILSLSAVLNLPIPFPLAFSFCSSSLWDLVRLTEVHPSDRSSSAVAGRCSACRRPLRRCPAWSKDSEFRAVAEVGKRCLFFHFPVLSCSAHEWVTSAAQQDRLPETAAVVMHK